MLFYFCFCLGFDLDYYYNLFKVCITENLWAISSCAYIYHPKRLFFPIHDVYSILYDYSKQIIGAASSSVQKSENAALDFDSVQRGDAGMENRMNRLMRACSDLGANNPIVSVHDQGAGGNGNVLKEIVEPAGAEYDIRKVRIVLLFS